MPVQLTFHENGIHSCRRDYLQAMIESLLPVSSDFSPTENRRGGLKVSLPPRYAITVTAEGNYFPMWYYLPGSERSNQERKTSSNADHSTYLLCHLHWEEQVIPLAYESPISSTRKGRSGIIICPSVKEAGDWCWREYEQYILQGVWERLERTIALYPERAGWYLEEIERLLANIEQCLAMHPDAIRQNIQVRAWHITIDGLSTCVSASITAQSPHDGWEEIITVKTETVDEVWEALYEEVWQWLQTLRNDTHTINPGHLNTACDEVNS